jgi:hypothetical protein
MSGHLAVSEPTPKACRPLFTTGAGLTDPGVLELGFGEQSTSNHDGSGARTFPTQLKLGINQWFDLRAGWSGHVRRWDSSGQSTMGFGDPQIGGQVFLSGQEKTGVDLGLAYWHKIPRASVLKQIITGRPDDSLMLVLSRTLGRWGIDLNAGVNWIGIHDTNPPSQDQRGVLRRDLRALP